MDFFRSTLSFETKISIFLSDGDTLNANPFSEENIERVIDTGAGYLLKSGSKDDKDKVRPRRFFEEKHYEEEPCEEPGFNLGFPIQSYKSI